ncbi:MAG: polysaccharide deacetylase family protein [Candidatus Omnitrophica bacterium]|nr:polysaccharide deacetylase family protein [Candidatus Omnitrophota bacterium]MDD5574235.1 polysaccharide deacetylase family protein [Candidatus Omnitrophota bacterium]
MMLLSDKLKVLLKLWLETRRPRIFSFHDCLPDVFSEYVELLIYKRYRILGARDLLARLNEKTPAGRDVVLTFDDGRRNCWSVIFPLLKKYKVHASIFVIPSRISDSEEEYPNLEDFWKGRVSWENLYVSHRKQPYLTWRELRQMRASGLVDIFSHSLRHQIVAVGSRIIDFQHPGVYEMPVYFDEWFEGGMPSVDSIWGVPVYERAWAPLAPNVYFPDRKIDILMNEFVKQNGGFLFFKKKRWRERLWEYYEQHRRLVALGHYRKALDREEARPSIFESKRLIEDILGEDCPFFSLPLYQGFQETSPLLEEAGYKAVFAGPQPPDTRGKPLAVFCRIPSFWIKFLTYF